MKFLIKKFLNDKIVKNHISLIYEVLINDKLIKKDFCKSFTPNFLQMIYAMANQGGISFTNSDWFISNVNIFSGSGTPVNSSNPSGFFRGDNTLDVNNGIRLSTDTTPININDYTLVGLITNGTGVGQLNFSNATGQGITYSGNTSSFRISRAFTNLSGASITVNKFYWYGNASYKFIEELIPNTIVGVNQTITIALTFSITT